MSQGNFTNSKFLNRLFGCASAMLVAFHASGSNVVLAATAATPTKIENQPANSETATLFKEIAELVKEYFPKAKITTTPKSIHFEYQVHERLHPYTRRIVLSPELDGILGDIEIKPGEPKDNSSLPVEHPETIHSVWLMAPYSASEKSCLSTRLVFQPITPLDFMEAFKKLIGTYNTGDDGSESAPAVDSKGEQSKVPVTTNTETETPPAITPSAAVTSMSPSAVSSVSPTVVSTTPITTPSPIESPHPVATAVPVATAAPLETANQPEIAHSGEVTTSHSMMDKYTYPEGRFKVMLPGSPQVKYTDSSGMRMVDYVYTDPDGTFNISYVILPEPPTNLRTSQLLDNMSQSVVNSLKGLHAKQYPSALQGFPGCQIEMAELTNKPGQSARFRIYIVKNFIYIVGLAGKKDWLNTPNAKEFLDTFQVNPVLSSSEQRIQAQADLERARKIREQEILRLNTDPRAGVGRSQLQKDAERSRAESENNRWRR